MAWNPSPQVAAAREIGRKFDKHTVIVLTLSRFPATLECWTYGEDKALCAEAKVLGDAAYEAVMQKYGEMDHDF